MGVRWRFQNLWGEEREHLSWRGIVGKNSFLWEKTGNPNDGFKSGHEETQIKTGVTTNEKRPNSPFLWVKGGSNEGAIGKKAKGSTGTIERMQGSRKLNHDPGERVPVCKMKGPEVSKGTGEV